jgi:hypothetical protein
VNDAYHDTRQLPAAGPWSTALLVALGVVLVTLLGGLVVLCVNPPAGFSPRFGDDADVSRFFPGFWRGWPHPATPGGFRAWAAGAVVGAWVVYGVALWRLGRLAWPQGRRVLVIVGVASLVAHALLVLGPPIVSNDLFRYAVLGRMVNLSALNPFLAPPAAMAPDPILPYATWPGVASNYGPTFIWLASLAAQAGGNGVFGAALAFKVLAVLFGVASALLVRAVARALHGGDGNWAFAAYAWNPMVIVETASMGHNETVMLALALGGLLLVQRGRPLLGWTALVMSADVKQLTAALALLFAVQFVWSGAGARERVRRALSLAAVAAGVLVALWFPFWGGLQVFGSSRDLLFDGKKLLPPTGATAVKPWVAVTFVAVVIAAAVAAARARLPRVTELAAGLMLVFIVLVYPFRFPWYSMSPLVLFAVNARTRPRVMMFGVCVLWGAALTLQYAFALHPIRR